MKDKLKVKLTAPKEYVRNRSNRPDKLEHNVIENMFQKWEYRRGASFFEVAKVKGKDVFRFVLPEYCGESCLSCHG